MDTSGNAPKTLSSSRLSVDPEQLLRFQQERIIKNYQRQILELLESLEHDHDTALQKLNDFLPAEYVKYVQLADYLDEKKAGMIRKYVLDHGGNACRSLQEILSQFDVGIRK